MKIQVLGIGDQNTNQMFENVQKAVDRLGIKAEIIKITDSRKILEDFNVTTMPALAFDGVIRSDGTVLTPDEISELLYKYEQVVHTVSWKEKARNRVLFVCIHNSARSQMAEGFLNAYAFGEFEAESAGFDPGELNPFAVKAMAEKDIDISGNSCDGVFDFYKQNRRFNYIVTVCDEGTAQRCPIFPGTRKHIHWSFEDPAGFEGSETEKLDKTRVVRDQIENKVKEFIALVNSGKIEENAPDDWKFDINSSGQQA